MSVGKILQKVFAILPFSEADWKRIHVKLQDATLIIKEEFQKNIEDLYTKILDLKKSLNFDKVDKILRVENTCDISPCFLKNLFEFESILDDPLKYYLELAFHIENLKYNLEEECVKCFKKLYRKLVDIRKTLEETSLIKEYLKLPYDIKIKPLDFIYEQLIPFEITPAATAPAESINPLIVNPVECYEIGPYIINIYPPTLDSTEYLYVARPFLSEKESVTLLKLFRNYIQGLNYFSHETEDYYTIDYLTDIRRKQAESFIKATSLNIPLEYEKKIVDYLASQTTPLSVLTPFLLDDEIEEVFIDSPRSKIYLDHRKFGRCTTPQLMDKSEFDKMVTYLRAVTGLRLDAKNPSMKTELLTKNFHVRVSVDIPPLAADGFHVDIRKLRRKYFSLTELIANKTLTAESAAYLYFCMLRRRNILVLGRPGEGKTTLINALDSITPPLWRKITIEDVIESIDQSGLRHQTRFQVEPLESGGRSSCKAKEIVKLLHRSPDYLIISEIQTEEDSKALFHALAAGLSGLFTCHGNTVEELLLRWSVHHKIPVVSFYELDLLIHVKKFDLHKIPVRKIVRIAEITNIPDNLFSNATPEIQDIFTWDVRDEKLVLATDLYETPTVKKIRRYEDLRKEQFYNELNTYRIIFELLSQKRVFALEENTRIFSKLYSLLYRIKHTEKTVDWDEVLLWFQREIGG
ncbi:MAG: Flp pilus assembly complex ATPase component TadA [Candidatus Odinarchaeum yellowstonii]|uniref:Flp pilus assembly complex ATPase component TadA n=1 Tax=Odinarchaeota yellowstonii (strain LCB_4) TaxID=1841599 RepID=A0AAF0IC16_ODILC|nr:MAG: Flp pilus assembly complex ATPase component TadA [Candidatus Odinarchaeum yellowstonii]